MRLHHEITVEREKCIGCGLCVGDCPSANLAIREKKAVVLTNDCIKCGHCEAICPRAAVKLSGFQKEESKTSVESAIDPDVMLAALRRRRSIRKFRSNPIPQQTIDRIIEAGRLTPTGRNAQDVKYFILTKEIDACERLAVSLFRSVAAILKPFVKTLRRVAVDDRFFFKNAPTAIVVAAKDRIDGALAAADMSLVAEACGLGVLYSGFFCMAVNHGKRLKKLIGLPKKYKAVATLVLGESDVKYQRPAPKETADVRNL